MEEDKLIQERKEKVFNFLKQKYNWIVYILLAFIVYIAVYIRTRPIPNLKDISTGGWTLGPDLDPFLFLRWAKYIVQHGSLYAMDPMRYVPVGYDTRGELLLHPYMIAWFHKYLGFLFGSNSVTYSAIIYPVVFFALTVMVFFFLVRKIFIDSTGAKEANIIALASAFFLSVIPSLLPRTIAGIPEKESAGFFFIFASFYLFLSAWKAKSNFGKYSLAILSGLFTSGMALVWGGVQFIYLTISLSFFISFIFWKVKKDKIIIFSLWLFFGYFPAGIFSTRYAVTSFFTSTTTLIALFVLLTSIVNLILFKTKIKSYFESSKLSKIPPQLISIITVIVFGVLASIFVFGFSFLTDKLSDLIQPLINPITDRLGVTVAENRQPFFSEWESNFGPTVKGIALFFWLFFIGSIYLFYSIIKKFTKNERLVLTASYTYFLFAIIFSRYKSSSVFNGTNTTSILFYLSGVAVLLLAFGYYHYKNYNLGHKYKFTSIPFGLIMLMSLFFFGIVSARGAVRIIMVLAIPASVVVSYFVVSLTSNTAKTKESKSGNLMWVLVGVILISTIFSGYYFYKSSVHTATRYVPSPYTHQWQNAMSWVRNNTPSDAVFAHWWDYGYWLQSIGERATMLDGGNAIAYWNHLMGRYVLTGSNNSEALEVLYSHNVTHFLIDSTDIGKYSAFSLIGSDENYDRKSWITTFVRDPTKMQETKNSTLNMYVGGFILDEDLSYSSNGTTVNLPGYKSGLVGIIIERNASGDIISQPHGIFIYQGRRYNLPLRYVFDGKMIDFNSGVDAGIFTLPRLVKSGSGGKIDYDGALLYLSNRTVKSQLARLYLYNEDNPYFKLAHVEDDVYIKQIRESNNLPLGRFLVYNGGFHGPIKIWEVNYPDGMKVNPVYIQKDFPNPLLSVA